MNNSEWSKEFPQVSGVYWARWQALGEATVIEVIGTRFYMIGRSGLRPDHEVPSPVEFLGPITPEDSTRARQEAVTIVKALLHAQRCPLCNDVGYTVVGSTDYPEQEMCEFCETTPDSLYKSKCNAREFIEAARDKEKADG